MLGRTHRFHGRKALNGVYKKGRTVRSPMIGLRYASRGAGRPYRVAVVVSRKVNRSAVARNRIRRRIYAAARGNAVLISPGTDMIFTVFDDRVKDLPPEKLGETVAGLLKKTAR